MKRCPQCRRDYYDDTLLYCLDDGAHLVEGPANQEPATAILSEPEAVATGFRSAEATGESPTRILAPDTTSAADKPIRAALRKRLFVVAGVLVTALGIGGYLYYGRGGSRQIDSIAVMPFTNESGNAEIDYLSDGMTETLISTLTQLPNLKVKPRSSAFRYKGRESEAGTIGSELNVRAILNGRLVQRGDDITLFLSLIDTGTEDQIWGKQYSRKIANLVALQTEVARDVSESLKTKLSGTDQKTLAKTYTANPEAYRLYLQGRFFWNKRRIGENAKAIGYFQQAIALDPDFALAYAGFADAVAQSSDLVPHSEREKKAKDAVLKALSLDPDLAEAHAALAHIIIRYDLDFVGAEKELQRALELDPKWADTYQRYGELYTFQGRHEEALAKYRQGLEVEPFNIPLHSSYGSALTLSRRYDEAIVQLRQTLEMDSNFRNARSGLYVAYWMKGMAAESVEERAKTLELAGMSEFATRIRHSFAENGWAAYLRTENDRYATEAERTIDRSSYYAEAIILTAMGEKDKAFAVLEKSVDAGENPALVFLRVEPRFDALRDDPRFTELLKKVGF